MKSTSYNKNYNNEIVLSNKALQKIIIFFLFQCPVKGVSFRGRSFDQYGFHGSSDFSKLKRALLNAADSSLHKNYYPCKKDEHPEKFKLTEDIDPPDEYCVFLKSSEHRVIESLFSAIRNAIAHGSFNVKEYKRVRIYYFCNFKTYKKAEIVLRESTLLQWIKIIQSKEI